LRSERSRSRSQSPQPAVDERRISTPFHRDLHICSAKTASDRPIGSSGPTCNKRNAVGLRARVLFEDRHQTARGQLSLIEKLISGSDFSGVIQDDDLRANGLNVSARIDHLPDDSYDVVMSLRSALAKPAVLFDDPALVGTCYSGFELLVTTNGNAGRHVHSVIGPERANGCPTELVFTCIPEFDVTVGLKICNVVRVHGVILYERARSGKKVHRCYSATEISRRR